MFRCVESKCQVNEDVIIYIGKLQKDFFYQYLIDHDCDFYEPLSKRVDLKVFAEKVSRLSTTFVITLNGYMAGLIASYFYDAESRKGFITLVHTKKEFRGKRLAWRLVNAVIHYAKMKNFLYVDLVVYKDNITAFNLYLSSGFKVITDNCGRYVLRNIVK